MFEVARRNLFAGRPLRKAIAEGDWSGEDLAKWPQRQHAASQLYDDLPLVKRRSAPGTRSAGVGQQIPTGDAP
jgi:hypothetical protein